MSKKNETKEKFNKVLLVIVVIAILISLVVIVMKKIGPINGELHCSYKNNTNTMINSFDYNLSFKNKNDRDLLIKIAETMVGDQDEK